MDALKAQFKGEGRMPAYKDKTKGTWYVSFSYIDWTGKKNTEAEKRVKNMVSLKMSHP